MWFCVFKCGWSVYPIHRMYILSHSDDPCKLVKGDHVIVLFTMFSGIDPHEVLLRAAQPLGITVYFGLPAAPRQANGDIWQEYLPAYYGFVQRVLMSHNVK